jgi:23S rRNA pseudouridine2457 synthase
LYSDTILNPSKQNYLCSHKQSNKMPHSHFIIHKPYGYLSQFIYELKEKEIAGELYNFPIGTMAIGRLDEDSEGLLLLTTDGMMSEIIRRKK